MERINKLDALQIETIINRIVPLIAKPEDQEFFRGILYIKAESSTASEFACFIQKLLNK